MKNKSAYLLTLIAWVFYAFLSLNAPVARTNPYNLTRESSVLLQWTIIAPILLIWLAAVYGAVNLSSYAALVKNTKDGSGMQPVSTGINIIVGHLFLSSLIGTIRPYVRYEPGVIEIMTIITNLLYVLFYVVAFGFIFYGSKKLLEVYKGAKPNTNLVIVSLFILLVLMYYYLDFIFMNPNRTVALSIDSPASYYLSDALIMLTIAVPSFITWVCGILAVVNLHSLSQRVIGVVYKKAIMNISYGVLFIVLSSMFIQGFSSVGSARLLQAGFSGILIIIYTLLLVMVIGYILVAVGSRRLSRIENV